MKGTFALFLLAGLTSSVFAKPLVTVSIPPQEYFVKKIAGSTIDVNVVLPGNVDEHNFEFKPSVMKKLERSDIYFTSGLEFEEIWLPRFKQNYKNLIVVNTQERIALKDMEYEHHHDDDDDDDHEGHGKHEGHAHGHNSHKEHAHGSHDHKHESGVFSDSEVKDRALSDWYGEFKNIYPYLLDGSFDGVLKARADNDPNKDFKAYKEYYKRGYESDIDKIVIEGSTMSFYRGKNVVSANYAYKGYEILTYESGKRGVRYQFEAENPNGAPKYIQFSDHQISPTKVNHFHIYMANTSFKEMLKELENWPTFYKGYMSKEEIIDDMYAHINPNYKNAEEEKDPHTWLDPLLVKEQAQTIAEALIQKYPKHKELYEKNLREFQAELDELHKNIQNQFNGLKRKEFIVYHPSWGYFASRYNLVQIPVEIEGKEPKPADVSRLIQKAKEDNIKVIFVQPGFSQKSAKLIAKESKAKVVQIDHLASDWKKELLKSVEQISKSMK